MGSAADAEALWARHDADWRNPAAVVSGWPHAAATDPALLRHRTRGDWWDVLEGLGATLLVSREYEHLLMALTVVDGRPSVTYMPIPHPSGIAFDEPRGRVHVAATRNPNQVLELAPVEAALERADVAPPSVDERPLVPLRTRFYPGSLYLHDLALVGGVLHGNAVAHNAVVRLGEDGSFERVWWPACVETSGEPDFSRNYIQLNSIAAGRDLPSSAFSASAERVSRRRPGHRNFPVDRRGVIFSGRTREPLARGLTRPHSARWHAGRLWVDDSGYGRVGVAEDGGFTAVADLEGWTRGLCFRDGVAFVGTSRVIPRFRAYAPGLDVDRSACGVHAVAVDSGRVLGSILWPSGNQVFAVESVPAAFSLGFPFHPGRRRSGHITRLFYSFATSQIPEDTR